MSESRKKHPLTTKEEAEKQVAEFDKVQPINKGSSERIIPKGGENPDDCHLCNTKDLDKVEDLLSAMEDIAHGDLGEKLAYAKKHLSDAYKVQPINKGSSARIIHKGVENPADCRLNSCPFCGVIKNKSSTPVKPILMDGYNKPTNIEGTGNPPYYVQCSYCLGTGPPAVDGVDAVEYWNERDSEENYKTMKEETWAEEHKDIWEAKAWREMRDVDAIVEERDALISENARLHNIIIELHRIIETEG